MVIYTRLTWQNDQTPAINDTNLNNIEAGIDALYNEFDANTILIANVNNTPIKLSVAVSTFLGRKAAGNIAAMTVAEAKTLLAIAITDISDIPGTIASILTDHDKAAHDALDIAPASHGAAKHTDRTRYMWLGTPHYFTGAAEKYGIALDPDADELVTYSFPVLTDFVSFSNLYVYYAADITANNVVLDIASDYAAAGQAQNVHSDSDAANVIAIGDTNRQRFTTAGLLASIAAGDIGFITVTRDANHGSDDNTGDLVINGVLIEYTADM